MGVEADKVCTEVEAAVAVLLIEGRVEVALDLKYLCCSI